LARRYSPDVNFWDRDTQALFEEIVAAYRVLSDSTARTVYDRRPVVEGRGAAPGRTSPRTVGRPGEDLHATVELSFQQAASGVATDVKVERLSPCRACQATGSRPGASAALCRHCGGTGAVWTNRGVIAPETCPACDGAGERVSDPCPDCRGRGACSETATVAVAIPAGVDTGVQLRVPGEGHAGPFGGPRGDLIVVTRVHEDAAFTRKGDNLYIGLTVGGLISGLISQRLRSRKKVVLLYILLTLFFIVLYLFMPTTSSTYFYPICFMLGASIGYWAMFVTIAAEQFGTNLRSTVATSVPNFIRWTVVPLTLVFGFMRPGIGRSVSFHFALPVPWSPFSFSTGSPPGFLWEIPGL